MSTKVYSDVSKVVKMDDAFSQLAAGFMKDGETKKAEQVFSAYKTLTPEAKAKLFDILRNLAD